MLTPQLPTNNTNTHRSIEDKAMPNFDLSFSDDDAAQSVSLKNDNFNPSINPMILKNLLATLFVLTPLNHLLKVVTHVSPQASNVLVVHL
jgi:hypothetical protein